MINLKFTNNERDQFLKSIADLRKLHTNKEYITKELEFTLRTRFPELLGGFIPFIKDETCFGSPFHRIVINSQVRDDKVNGRLHKYEDVKYPPNHVLDKIGYNRANIPNKSIFYAGYGMLNVGLETKPKLGSLITESEWLQKQDTLVKYLPIFHKKEIIDKTTEFQEDWIRFKSSLEKLDKNVSIVVENFFDFLATVFIAEVNPNNRVEYIMSAMFSDLFMYDPKFNVDCIYYPGVQIGLISSNIAIKPNVLDNIFEIKGITEQICTYSDEKFQNKFLTHRTACAIDINIIEEFIKWNSISINDKAIINLLEEYKVDFN